MEAIDRGCGLLADLAIGKAAGAKVIGVVGGPEKAKIAKRCGITLSALVMANPHIKQPNRIYPGQKIRIAA